MKTTINIKEIEKFKKLSDNWWDVEGPLKPLHQMNPCRISYITQSIKNHFNTEQFDGLNLIDIGCGGGIITEPMARLGFDVTGIDACYDNIEIAKLHAENMNLNVKYECNTAEQLATVSSHSFDIVLALEIVEHVSNVELFLKSCLELLKPNGLLILSTLNKTISSYLLGIIAAEHILKWAPKGTHDWQQFLKPSEIQKILLRNNYKISDIKGISYNIRHQNWELSSNIDINYIMLGTQYE